MDIKFTLCFVSILFACRGEENTIIEVDEAPIVIQISDALLNPQKEILLSELADSITYIPLETKEGCLLRSFPFFSFTSRYIAYLNYCFDWSGKFLFKVGKLGQGPGEESGEILSKITFCNGNFYTMGQKIIAYDSCSNFTGKELSLYAIDKLKGTITNRSMCNVIDFNSVGKNILLYSFPDTLFVMNENFEFISKFFVMPWDDKNLSTFSSNSSGYDQNMTSYKDDILFYSYFKDTVYQITERLIHPRWIIKLDELKLSDEALYRYNELLDAAKTDFLNGQLEKTHLMKLMENKYMVLKVNESDNFVFILAKEIKPFCELRKLAEASPILIYYNKKTKTVKSTIKIKDDLTGFPDFFPLFGLADEKMIDTFWPYDQEKWLMEKAEKDWRFSQYANRDFMEDNPIVIVAHLKK